VVDEIRRKKKKESKVIEEVNEIRRKKKESKVIEEVNF